MSSAAALRHLRLVRPNESENGGKEFDPPAGFTNLDHNLVVFAGAGAGKTYNLVTQCLHVLAGARTDRTSVGPHQLFLLTFTDKAAAEMRERLRNRLTQLATGGSTARESEPELADSLTRLEIDFPKASFWARVSGELGGSTISTFHSLCLQLLRRAPAGSGVDPAFEILEERESGSLLRDVAERETLSALEQEDISVFEMCTELGFSSGKRRWGVVDLVCRTLTKLREEGFELDRVTIGDEKAALIDFRNAVDTVTEVAHRAGSLDQSGKGRFTPVLDQCMAALREMSAENFVDRFESLRAALLSEPNLARQKDELGQALKELKSGAIGNTDKKIDGLRDFYAAIAVARHERRFRDLLVSVDRRFRGELKRRAVLDFSAILIQTRDLLRDDLVFRAEVQGRIGALLVDEFQDTNRLQLDIVTLLAERREGGPRNLSSRLPLERAWGLQAIQQLPLQPGLLCVVGDRKQSIYEFRGADVSIFSQLSEHLLREGGGQVHLRQNWRSVPALLDFFNCSFREFMRPKREGRDYEIGYRVEDDLLAVRPAVQQSRTVDRICFDPPDAAVESRMVEADLLARRICQLLKPESPLLVADRDGTVRAARGGDIAIVFRRFSFLEVYRQAMVRYRVPHRVIRGRGFYAAQEVLDIASFLTLLSDPHHAIALGAVLRSPFVALSDESLFRIATESGRKIDLSQLESERWNGPRYLGSEELRRLRCFLQVFKRLRAERDRFGLRQLLKIALEETGYRIAIAASPFGEQSIANVEKLLQMASARDREGRGDCTEFASELETLVEADPSEAQADLLEAGDPQAVELLTIHQAKGLEWPIVAIADLAAQRVRSRPMVVFDRTLGLAMRPWLPNEGRCSSPRYRRVTEELSQREEAESIRLLYVAMTRARDHLILSGRGKNESGTWRQTIDALITASTQARAMVTDLSAAELEVTPLAPPPLPNAEPAVATRAEMILRQVREPPKAKATTLVFPVTQLQDFFLCPRRYLYSHRIGLSEFPIVFELEDLDRGESELGRQSVDARDRGTLAHRLLEQVDHALVSREGPLRESLRELASGQGFDPQGEAVQEIIGAVSAFLRSEFMRKVIASGPDKLHRELPFFLQLGGEGVHLKGAIDLLWEDDQGGATVIDYKYSQRHPSGLEPYQFQLHCYALAASELVSSGLPVKTGIVFLREHEPIVRLCQPQAEPALAEFKRRLLSGVSRLTELQNSTRWPGLEQPRCEAIGCGYQYRCHARAVT